MNSLSLYVDRVLHSCTATSGTIRGLAVLEDSSNGCLQSSGGENTA